MRQVLITIVCLLLCCKCFSQNEISISGSVTNEHESPLSGATIRAVKSKKYVTTDYKGIFHLSGIKQGDTVIVSMVGYFHKIIVLSNESDLKIQLLPNDNSMNDVVVIGYGTVKRKDLTGSVGSANIEDMSKAPVVSFQDALAGRIAGVQVTSPDGQPGAESSILIRGGNSITQSDAPLYVVDGFPLEDADISSINPDDIESIDVLKDASSTAIYGARGANGVVIVTTKQGKIGAPAVSYNSWVGTQQPIKRIKIMSPYEFVQYQLDLDSVSMAPRYLSDGKTLDYYKTVKGIDWQNLIFKNSLAQNHSLSVRGGTAATKYSLTGSFLDQNGVLINTGFKRYQGRFQISQQIGKYVKVGINTNYAYSIRNGQIVNTTNDDSYVGGGSGNVSTYRMYAAWGYRPVSGGNDEDLADDPFDPDETSTTELSSNPLLAAKNTFNYAFRQSFYSNAYLDISFLRNFKLRITGGMTENDTKSEVFNNSNTAAGNPNTTYGQTYGINGSINNAYIRNLLNENLLTYTKVFNKKSTLDVLGGFTMQRANTDNNGFRSVLLPNEVLGINGLDQGTIETTTTGASYSTLVSFLGRINYNYDSRFLLTASFRSDGSSKFSQDNRWGYFPSGAFAWNFGNEKFMRKIKAVSNAKLRISYGLTGNNRVTDFAYLGVLQQNFVANSGNTTSGYYFGGTYIPGTVPTSVPNQNLKWETTANLDVGLDIGLLKERISLTTDYYYKKTTNLLLNATLPSSTGYATAYKNIGAVANDGLEITLNTVNIDSKNFTWSSNFNIAFNRNKILKLNGGQGSLTTAVSWNANFNTASYIALPGHEVALFYGFVSDGLYQLKDFDVSPNGTYQLKSNVPNNGNDRSTIQPGYIKYKDLNGDGIVNTNDETVIGDPNPIHIGGFTNNFRYKHFDLNIFFQWSYGNEILNANRIIFEGAQARQNLNMFASYADRWSIDNQSSRMPIARGYGPNVYSDRDIEDGSYLRLKTVSFGYNFSPGLLQKISIKTARISFAAQNLLTWTKYSGVDPEVSVRNSALTPGFDWSPYPRARTMTISLNLNF